LLLSLAATFIVPVFAATIEALQTIPLMCFGSGEMSGYEKPGQGNCKDWDDQAQIFLALAVDW
jgi:hypothetical protein